MDKELKYTYDKNNTMVIDGCNTLDLVKKYGSPLYILSESVLRNRCELFKNILEELYPNSYVSYASKAFCCKAIYNIIKEYDFHCDIVSGGELFTALKAKFDTSKMYFHGNNKSEEEIKFALKNKLYNFVVDNIDELETLESFVNKNKNLENKLNLIVRINPGVEAHTHEYIVTSLLNSKFGESIFDKDKINNYNWSNYFYSIDSNYNYRLFNTPSYNVYRFSN